MKKHGKNKGFTLVEGVIALTVITIISAAVTTLCITSSRSTAKLFSRFQATNIAADVVSCFKSACEDTGNEQSAFESYLEFYVGETVSGTESGSVYLYEFTMDMVDAEVTADFVNEEVNINTYHSSLGSSLYSYSYSLSNGN
ncbi:MAG: prepilin-type N-terminal cleavage/methylation domain-containing protein [Clostridia bacterium]|nr:prepilin-type N-terminal cleavage/methylation domain-containing protein [Clostridia bacterium]